MRVRRMSVIQDGEEAVVHLTFGQQEPVVAAVAAVAVGPPASAGLAWALAAVAAAGYPTAFENDATALVGGIVRSMVW